MAIDTVKELIEAVRTDPGVQEALQGLTRPSDADGFIRYLAEAAKKLGFDVTEAEIQETLAAASKERMDKTETAAGKVEALADEALNQVVGGYDYNTVDNMYACGNNHQDVPTFECSVSMTHNTQ